MFDLQIPPGIEVRWVDFLEIAIVAYVLYRLYQLMRGTIAVQIFVGIFVLYLVQVAVGFAKMTILQALFDSISSVFVLAIIVLFQPEIRRLLLLIGQNPLIRRFISSSAQEERLSEVVEAVAEMSEQRIGALIAFERSTGLRSYIETGAPLHAEMTRELLVTIFYAQNPLHDGAVIIRDRRIEAARCILPVSTSMKLSPHLGLRHRSAVGLTEQTDAFVIIVSEETGTISVAEDGVLRSGLSPEELQAYLGQALLHRTGEPEQAPVADA